MTRILSIIGLVSIAYIVIQFAVGVIALSLLTGSIESTIDMIMGLK